MFGHFVFIDSRCIFEDSFLNFKQEAFSFSIERQRRPRYCEKPFFNTEDDTKGQG